SHWSMISEPLRSRTREEPRPAPAPSTPAPTRFDASTVLALQRTAGNHGVARLLSRTPAPAASPASASPASVPVSIRDGAPPTTVLGPKIWGHTWPEGIEVAFTARQDAGQWRPSLTAIVGRYALQKRLLPGHDEVTGPGGNTTAANYCDQLDGLESLGERNQWYMERAVEAHEQAHATRLAPVLEAGAPKLVSALEAIAIPDDGTLDAQSAEAALRADPAFETALADALKRWRFDVIDAAALDDVPNGPTAQAEHVVVDPMIAAIREEAQRSGWPACGAQPAAGP
ncbi:MAG TPA: hypothetical protein VI300_11715, partial [Solirubrobacter sp.]